MTLCCFVRFRFLFMGYINGEIKRLNLREIEFIYGKIKYKEHSQKQTHAGTHHGGADDVDIGIGEYISQRF